MAPRCSQPDLQPAIMPTPRSYALIQQKSVARMLVTVAYPTDIAVLMRACFSPFDKLFDVRPRRRILELAFMCSLESSPLSLSRGRAVSSARAAFDWIRPTLEASHASSSP